ncbi:MAG TPA: threonine/serine exporter family protein [Symbiobacteriaceae bacterium]|jgi:uncharacterized membrane protein YjjB (DUF3815 family)
MLNFLAAFTTSAAAAAAFRGPLRAVWASGLTGLLGYITYELARALHAPQVLAAFVGALTIGAAGELLARYLRQPTLLFIVPGLFPLAPGFMAYTGMLELARGQVASAGHELTQTMFYAGSLAAGLALPPALLRRNRG